MAVKRFKPDKDKAKKMAASSRGGGGGGSDFKWAYTHVNGDYKMRILPPWNEKGLVGMIVGKHYAIPGEEPDDLEKHTCIEATHPDMEMECPICNVIRKYKEEGMDMDKYSVREKSYMNAVLIDAPQEFLAADDNISKGDVVIFIQPPTTFDWVCRQIVDEDVGDITDPENGFDVKITRKKTKAGIRYDRKVIPKPRPIADSEEGIVEVLDNMYELDKIWSEPDDEIYEKIKAGADRLDNILKSRLKRTKEASSVPGKEVQEKVKNSQSKPDEPSTPKPSSPKIENGDVKVWYSTPEDDDVMEGTVNEVAEKIKEGSDYEEVLLMPYDQSDDWKTAKEWGIPATEELN